MPIRIRNKEAQRLDYKKSLQKVVYKDMDKDPPNLYLPKLDKTVRPCNNLHSKRKQKTKINLKNHKLV